MKINSLSILTFFIGFMMTSCYQPIEIPFDDEQRLKVMSEVVLEDDIVQVDVSSTIPVGSDYEFLDIDESTVVTLNDGESTYPLTYIGNTVINKVEIENSGRFEVPFNLQVARDYNISVSYPEDFVPEASATTSIPPKTNFKSLKMLNFEVVDKDPQDGRIKTFEYTVSFEIANDGEFQRYFWVQPFWREVSGEKESGPDPSDFTNNFFQQKNFNFIKGGDACINLSSKYGFVIDVMKLDENDQEIILKFSNKEPIDTKLYWHQYVHMFLHAVNGDFHSYHKAVSAAIDANSFNIEEPVIDNSNVENGRGLVAGLSLKIDSVLVRN